MMTCVQLALTAQLIGVSACAGLIGANQMMTGDKFQTNAI